MIYQLLISDEATYDIADALLWYENELPGLGSDFEEMLDQAFHLITSDPFIFQIRYKKIRVFFLKKFPYGIHYTIAGDKLMVVAVFHCARNPKAWKTRTKKL